MSQIQLYKGNFSPIEQEVIKAAQMKTIAVRGEDRETLKKDLNLALTKIMRKVGIRIHASNTEEGRRQIVQIMDAMDLVMRHYYTFTIADIFNAFDFMLTGRLNSYIKQQDNRAPIDHYQSFDMSYISRVLNAYRSYKSETMKQFHRSNPEKPKQLTSEDKKRIESETWSMIAQQFERYKKTGTFKFLIPSETVRFLSEAGVDIKVGEVSDEDRKRALNRLLCVDFMDPDTKKNIVRRREDSSRVKIGAMDIKYNEGIKAFFEGMIETKKEINDIIKQK